MYKVNVQFEGEVDLKPSALRTQTFVALFEETIFLKSL